MTSVKGSVDFQMGFNPRVGLEVITSFITNSKKSKTSTRFEDTIIRFGFQVADGKESAFRGTTQIQSATVSKEVDKGMIRIYYYPITPEGININNFGSYLEELKYDPYFQEVLKNLELGNAPYIFGSEVEIAVSRPIPFENIVSMDVGSPDGWSYSRIESKTFDHGSIKRYILSDWNSWLIHLRRNKLLYGEERCFV